MSAWDGLSFDPSKARLYEVTATAREVAGGHVVIQITGDPKAILMMGDALIARMVRTAVETDFFTYDHEGD